MTATTNPTPQQILDLPLPDNDAGATTVRAYLLATLSAWQYDVYVPLVRAGLMPGTFDEYGELDDFDVDAADKLIVAAIEYMGAADSVPADRERYARYFDDAARHRRATGLLADEVRGNAFAEAASYLRDGSIWDGE